jgi:coiled-coil domain-containing protein 55
MIQREREAEGDEFRDKESFVTQAYKDQMVEVRKAEAEEKAREGVYRLYPHIHSVIDMY